MDGTRLNTAADRLTDLARQVDQFTNTASEKASEVAENIRDVADELRTMASSVGEGGTEGDTTPTA